MVVLTDSDIGHILFFVFTAIEFIALVYIRQMFDARPFECVSARA